MVDRRGWTVREVREALADLPDTMPVDLLIDHALAGHSEPQVTGCQDFDVEFLAPVIDVRRGASGSVEVMVDWESAG